MQGRYSAQGVGLSLAALLFVLWPLVAAGQGAQEEATVVVPGAEYAAGGLHRFIFGSAYRDLWATPIEVPVLDLETEAGGLEPVMVVGRMQTLGLAMRGADGRSYTFRGVYKDLVRGLPEELQDTAVADIAQDQLSASIPGGSLPAIAIARAVGVLQPMPRLVVMPDDPRLGEFRERFGGQLGTIAEYPTDGATGTFGATEIIGSEELLERITASSEQRLDAEALLRARLVDLLLGDWDRHAGQWRFARVPAEPDWQPIPEDHDQAFSRYEGLAMAFARNREPKFDVFGEDYQGIEGLVWNARSVDRRLLAGLGRDAYVAAAREIQERVTDAVIEGAVRRLPAEFVEQVGERLIRELRARRDGLVDEAEDFYEYLADEVNVFATNQADRVLIEIDEAGVEVTVSALDRSVDDVCGAAARGEPLYHRFLFRDETGSIRIYTGAGEDRVLLIGDDVGGIDVKIVGGADASTLCDLDGEVHAFDMSSAGDSGKGRKIAKQVWLAPSETIESAGTPEESQGPLLRAKRNWGSTWYRTPFGGWAADPGLILGVGIVKETFAFRKRPYSKHHELRLQFAFGVARPRIDYVGVYRTENSRFYWTARAVGSGIETLNFYGFGNETERGDDSAFHRVRQSTGGAEVRAAWQIGESVTLSTGPRMRYTVTKLGEGRGIDEIMPYGADDTGQVGWVGGFHFNNRVFPGNVNLKGSDDIFRFGPSPLGQGYTFDVDAVYYADTWDLDGDYGIANAQGGATYILGSTTAVGFKAGGTYTWGRIPYYDAAYIGSAEVRGLRMNRFAGNSSLYGNAGLMQRIGSLGLVLPGRWGVLIRGDAGRVWLDGEDSDVWHWSYGGGLWWSPWDLSTAVRLVAFRSDDGPSFYLLMGFDI